MHMSQARLACFALEPATSWHPLQLHPSISLGNSGILVGVSDSPVSSTQYWEGQSYPNEEGGRSWGAGWKSGCCGNPEVMAHSCCNPSHNRVQCLARAHKALFQRVAAVPLLAFRGGLGAQDLTSLLRLGHLQGWRRQGRVLSLGFRV